MIRQTYVCSRCKNQITVHVRLTHVPVCNRHAPKPHPMEENKTNGTTTKQNV
jgi:hypothetical protein